MSGNRLKLNVDKTELQWVTMRYSLHQRDFCLPELHLGHDSVVARQPVTMSVCWEQRSRLILASIDMSPPSVLASGFYWLRQLRHCQRSLDMHSSNDHDTRLVDCCNALLADVPKVTTDKLQQVMNAAACVITITHKFDRSLW